MDETLMPRLVATREELQSTVLSRTIERDRKRRLAKIRALVEIAIFNSRKRK